MIRVVLVDDHQLVRDGIKWMLVNEPSIEVVGEASNGGELFDVLAEVVVDVVLLDIRMPGMSGLEVMAELDERAEHPRVLMLSMYDEPGLVQQAIALGAAGYIKKSADRAELIRAIHAVGSGASYLQGELAAPLIATFDDFGPQSVPVLSPDERQILALVAEGLGNREIGVRLNRSEASIRTALHSIFGRLGVSSRSEAVAVALRMGAIE